MSERAIPEGGELHPARLRIQALHLRGQIESVRGSRRSGRWFEEAARLSGRDPAGDVDWILRAFIDDNLAEHDAEVRAAVPEDAALRPLVERLLEVAQRDLLE